MDGKRVTLAFIFAMIVVVLTFVVIKFGAQKAFLVVIPLIWAANNIVNDRLERWCEKNDREWTSWKCLAPNIAGILFALCMFVGFYSSERLPLEQAAYLLLYLGFGTLMAAAPVALKTDLRAIQSSGSPKIDWLLLSPPTIVSAISFLLFACSRSVS